MVRSRSGICLTQRFKISRVVLLLRSDTKLYLNILQWVHSGNRLHTLHILLDPICQIDQTDGSGLILAIDVHHHLHVDKTVMDVDVGLFTPSKQLLLKATQFQM